MTVEASPTSPAGTCPLPYPDRFHAAVYYVSNPPPDSKTFSEETQLLLYALNQQVTVGPCKTRKPWGWNVIETAKWTSWSQLADMPVMEAMRLYIRTLDEEQPNWWTRQQQETQRPAVAEPEAAAGAEASQEADASRAAQAAQGPASLFEAAQPAMWVTLELETPRKPLPRYEQGAAIAGNSCYVVGGHYGGRYLSDVWVLDMTSLQWSHANLQPAQELQQRQQQEQQDAPAHDDDRQQLLPPVPSLPPIAGHSVLPVLGKLLVLGGHAKRSPTRGKEATPPISVRTLDVKEMRWTELAPSGEVPTARGGHSATLVQNKIYMFGGEDVGRKAIADLYSLDLDELTWHRVQTQGKGPSPRSAHVAAAVDDRYLVIFGGGSVATCFADVHVLDLSTHIWSQPRCEGIKPTPRAGHAAAVLDKHWYIVGGGNNVKGCTDMLVADLSQLSEGLMRWDTVCTLPRGSPLSSEGSSMMAIPERQQLVTFGGYNGKYTNAVSVYQVGSPAREPEQQHTRPAGAAVPAASSLTPHPNQTATTTRRSTPGEEAARQSTPPKRPHSENGQAGSTPKAAQAAAAATAAAVSAASDLRQQLEQARREAESAVREAAAAKENAAIEQSLLRRQLSTSQAALTDAEKAVDETREQLQAEQSKSLHLEAELAELRNKLQRIDELERELETYRRQAQELEQKKSSGIWSYVTGAS